MKPKVSLIIPTYNNGALLGQTVESVLSQAAPFPVEIIIVDDGSTDQTAERLAAYKNRIRYLYQKNSGVSAARNHGLQLANGDYVVFLDGDDLLLPGKLAEQSACLDSRPEVGGIHSGWQMIDEQGRRLKNIEPWHETPALDLPAWLLWKPVFLGAIMFRRAWLEKTGGFDATLRQAEDVDLVWRLSLRGCRFDWLRQVTVGYRQHSHNTVRNGLRQAQDMSQVLNKFFARTDLPGHIRRLEYRVRYYTLLWLVWHLHRTGYGAEIATYLHQSRRYMPDEPILTAQRWLAQLSHHARRDGVDQQQLRCFWPHFQTALAADDATWPEIQSSLEWRQNVWWPYLMGDDSSGAGRLERYGVLQPAQVISLAQLCLLADPGGASVANIGQFWRDAVTTGLIPPEAEATTLYLTLAGQSFLSRRWRAGSQAFWQALRVGRSRQALPAWSRFLKAATGYLLSLSKAVFQNSGPGYPAVDYAGPEAVKLRAK